MQIILYIINENVMERFIMVLIWKFSNGYLYEKKNDSQVFVYFREQDVLVVLIC